MCTHEENNFDKLKRKKKKKRKKENKNNYDKFVSI